LKKYWKDYAFLFSISGLVILLDQWTKNLVRENLAIGEMWVPWDWLAPYARIIHWQNTGAAFGLGQNLSWIFTILAIVVVGAIIFYFPQGERSSWLHSRPQTGRQKQNLLRAYSGSVDPLNCQEHRPFACPVRYE